MTDLATAYDRYGYRRITMMLRKEGWLVNHKRIERLWRREGLKVPAKQPKRRWLWFNDGSCIRLQPQHRDHVRSYDFVFSRAHDGRPIRMLTIFDEFTRECLAIDVSRGLISEDVLERLSDLFIHRAHLNTSARTTSWKSQLTESLTGWRTLASKLCSSNQAVPGRTDSSSPSTESSEMSCSTWNCLTPCWKQEY